MDKEKLMVIEEDMKAFDSTYETKVVKPGNVITIYKELEDNTGILETKYVCKENDSNIPEKMGTLSLYEYNLFFKDALKDTTINTKNEIYTVKEIYDSYEDYIKNHGFICYGTIVDTTHNGMNIVYNLIKNNQEPANINDKGIIIVNEDAPLAKELTNLENKYRIGSDVTFDVCGIKNEIKINDIYYDYEDYKKAKGLIDYGTIVDTTHNGMSIIYNLIKNGQEPANPDDKGIIVVNEDAPLAKELTDISKRYRKGSNATFDVCGNKNEVIINDVYYSYRDYENARLIKEEEKIKRLGN